MFILQISHVKSQRIHFGHVMVAFTHPLAEGAHVEKSAIKVYDASDAWNLILRYWDIEVERIKKSGWLFGSPRFGVMSLVCDQEIRPEDDPEEAHLKEKQMTRCIELIQAPRCCFFVQIWILKSRYCSIYSMEMYGMERCNWRRRCRSHGTCAFYDNICYTKHISYIFSLDPVGLSFACSTFHTMCTSDARELILRHRKRWKPIRATRPTRLMMPTPQFVTVITVKIKGSDGLSSSPWKLRARDPFCNVWGSSNWSNTQFGGGKPRCCFRGSEVQDMFRERKCLKLDNFRGWTVQSLYSMKLPHEMVRSCWNGFPNRYGRVILLIQSKLYIAISFMDKVLAWNGRNIWRWDIHHVNWAWRKHGSTWCIRVLRNVLC